MSCNGRESHLCNFTDQAEAFSFQGEYQNVKNVIDDINFTKERANSSMSSDEYIGQLTRHWLPLVNSLEQKWGKALVPLDVRQAKNDVESNLQMPRTTWPQMMKL